MLPEAERVAVAVAEAELERAPAMVMDSRRSVTPRRRTRRRTPTVSV